MPLFDLPAPMAAAMVAEDDNKNFADGMHMIGNAWVENTCEETVRLGAENAHKLYKLLSTKADVLKLEADAAILATDADCERPSDERPAKQSRYGSPTRAVVPPPATGAAEDTESTQGPWARDVDLAAWAENVPSQELPDSKWLQPVAAEISNCETVGEHAEADDPAAEDASMLQDATGVQGTFFGNLPGDLMSIEFLSKPVPQICIWADVADRGHLNLARCAQRQRYRHSRCDVLALCAHLSVARHIPSILCSSYPIYPVSCQVALQKGLKQIHGHAYAGQTRVRRRL